MKRLVIATHNRKKAREIRQILSRSLPQLELLSFEDFTDAKEPEETGGTYEENAVIKSRCAAACLKEWCLADDAGLEVDALNGAPGIYSKRFAGESLPFSEKSARILEQIAGLEGPVRTARFRICVAVSPPGGSLKATKTFGAACEGRIALAPRGTNGFGYDPIFEIPELGKTMAELTQWEKHAVSHRGKVLNLAADWIRLSEASV